MRRAALEGQGRKDDNGAAEVRRLRALGTRLSGRLWSSRGQSRVSICSSCPASGARNLLSGACLKVFRLLLQFMFRGGRRAVRGKTSDVV